MYKAFIGENLYNLYYDVNNDLYNGIKQQKSIV